MNVRLRVSTDTFGPPQRARVLAFESEGVRVRLAETNDEHVVKLDQVEQRVVLPWKPTDLAQYFIISRRRHGQTEEYVEDLQVRRNMIRRILAFLTEKGDWRPDQGEETRHYYYGACECMSTHEIDEIFPADDYVPPDLNFQDADELLPHSSVDQGTFFQWLQEGQHDCDVAKAFGAAWARDLCGASTETFGDFFTSLFYDYSRDSQDADDALSPNAADVSRALPIPW